MGEKDKSPKVFISYSWTSREHRDWVISLAKRLVIDGVKVVLDKWDLRAGMDKYVFMEQMVVDPGMSKVLVICDKMYKEKAENRRGGVGEEALIISSEIYKVDQDKFIPIVREYDEKGQPCLPVFLKRFIYLDFFKDEEFDNQYRELLQVIFDRGKRPLMGFLTSSLLEDSVIDAEEMERLVQLAGLPTKREEVFEYLSESLLNREDPTERYWVYIALGKIGGQAAEQKITDVGLRDDNEFARSGAVTGLKILRGGLDLN